jgi:potassium voltage-gated channel Shab-related subfamily B protein 1
MPAILGDPTSLNILIKLGYLSLGWSTLENLVRLFAYPSIWIFFKDPINSVEFLSTFLLYPAILAYENSQSTNDIFRNIVRVSRIFTLVRLFRNTTSLRALKNALLSSFWEFFSFLFYLGLAVLIFGTLCYCFEFIEPDTKFVSVPGKLVSF